MKTHSLIASLIEVEFKLKVIDIMHDDDIKYPHDEMLSLLNTVQEAIGKVQGFDYEAHNYNMKQRDADDV